MTSSISTTEEHLPGVQAEREAGPPRVMSRRPLLLVGALLAAAVVSSYWMYERRFEETDDAQIDGTITHISPRVAGTVVAVYVVENQPVEAGDLLAELDPTELRIAADQARARVAEAEAQLGVEEPSVLITAAANDGGIASARAEIDTAVAAREVAEREVAQLVAQLAQAEAIDRTAQATKKRSEQLVKREAISSSEYEQASNAATASAAGVAAVKESLVAARHRVVEKEARIADWRSKLATTQANGPREVAAKKASVAARKAALDLARAQLAQAEQNLSYAKIVAPTAGVVVKRGLAVGERIEPGQYVVGVSQVDALWVMAAYRETQLRRMSPGQPADVHIDALGIELHGTVESIGGATGARLSVMPPENAAGNYVKVVQRIPVRIGLKGGQSGLDRLRVGMSVEPRVKVR